LIDKTSDWNSKG